MRQFKIVPTLTDRSENSISRYLIEVGHIDLLQHGEEVKLAMNARNGDHIAMERLIKTNLRFVVSVAKQYQNKGISLPDLISEGNLGLIKAAHKFDPTKGFKFVSFAVYWIRQHIIQAISDQKRTVRLPGNQILNMDKVSKAMFKLEQELQRLPALCEIAQLLEISEEKIADILSSGAVSISVEVQSTYTKVALIETLTNENSLSPIDHLFKESLTIDLNRMLNKLPLKERIILKYWYGIDQYPQLAPDDIALKVGLTSERVRQLRSKALKTLARLSKFNRVADYFSVK